MGACECEGENVDVLSDKIVKARKAHRCDECGREIKPGEPYRNLRGVSCGDMLVVKTCLFCQRVSDDLRGMGFCVPFNGLWDLVEQIERGEIAMTSKCLCCGEEIQDTWPRLSTSRGDICMRCEFKYIPVYTMVVNGNSYTERDVSGLLTAVGSELESMDIGDAFIVSKMTMLAGQYYSLPEFEGF